MKLGRLAEITRVFIEEGLARSPSSGDSNHAPSTEPGGQLDDERERGARLRRALERLGPTFVKFGQLLATRLDLFSPEFLAELGKLRTHVAPFPTAEARRIISEDIGAPVHKVFSEFPEAPVASASMAQVYRAKLRQTEEWVAVKVARPELRQTLERDLEVITDVSRLLDHLVPAYHRSMVHQVAIEYAARARQESDLLSEARAIEQFSTVVSSVPEFRVPLVMADWCGPRVVVMEWFEGPSLDAMEDATALSGTGHSPHSVALSVLRLQLVMSYEYGFVHGDTHPGNLILLADGRLGLIDFGLHGHVPRKLCDQMLELLFHQASGQTDRAIQTFEQIFTASRSMDHQRFQNELRAVLEAQPEPPNNSPLTGQLIGGLRLGARYGLRAQSELFLVLRNLTIVEGIVLTYCPEMKVIEESRAILQGILVRRALGGLNGGHGERLAALLLLNFAQRPEVVEGLLRLERSFSSAGSLGEFLEQEGVYRHQLPQRLPPWWMPLLVGFLGAIVGALVLRLLS